MKAFVKTLGCDKNTVDSEFMLGILREHKLDICYHPLEADVIIVNTCSFILDAKLESIDSITEYALIKKEKPDVILIVVGCLSQRYPDELLEEVPEIDAVLGASNFMDIYRVIDNLKTTNDAKNYTGDVNRGFEPETTRVLTTPAHYSYLKISEGCDNRCSYCIIPKLRGKYRSRKLDSIVKEAEFLAKSGVKELMIIAQDVSRYGLDFEDGTNLSTLLRELDKIDGLQWIRLHYLYPDIIDDELLYTIQNSKKVLHYFDMPFQHISDNVLKRMNRNISSEEIKRLITRIRTIVDHPVIRTTFIVGFPGETDDDYNELLNFINEYRLERVGVFKFSREEGTPSYNMKNQVSDETKEYRFINLLLAQEDISYEQQLDKVGSIQRVIIDDVEEGRYIARTYRDAPDIDGLCFVESDEKLSISEFYDVEITSSDVYDLIGRKL